MPHLAPSRKKTGSSVGGPTQARQGRLTELRKWSRGLKEARVPTVPRAGCEGSERAAQRGQLLDWQMTPLKYSAKC